MYLPEVSFSTARFLEDVGRIFARLGRCQIAVSEGIADRRRKPVAQVLAEKLGIELERDSHGNVQLSGSGALGDFLAGYVKDKLGPKYKSLRVRADTFGYLQRSFAGCASPVDAAEARKCGLKAVEYAMAGDLDGSVAIRRAKGSAYRASYFRARLRDVARDTKHMPRSYINKAGNGITAAFVRYALPLTGKLPVIGKLA